MGIGVPNVEEAWAWYRKFFGMNVKVFEDAAEAPLMTRYTGGTVHARTATLALSMEGGGGFEIWQYTSRNTEKAKFDIQLGDFGLFACRIKSRDVQKSYEHFKKHGADIVGGLQKRPDGRPHFFARDPYGNLFNIVDGLAYFSKTKHPSNCGGVAGAMIGVSNMEASLKVYQEILGYSKVVYDVTEEAPDFSSIEGGKGKVRRVLLTHPNPTEGPFSDLLGPSEMELVQHLEREDCKKIFQDRYWGDWGFIHMCFDIQGMELLKSECEEKGQPFTVDSGETFDMGEAGGRFSYIEDPDGTWIEFVETHKVPVMKKWNWYIDLTKRDPSKKLPRWMLKAMGLNKVKD